MAFVFSPDFNWQKTSPGRQISSRLPLSVRSLFCLFKKFRQMIYGGYVKAAPGKPHIQRCQEAELSCLSACSTRLGVRLPWCRHESKILPQLFMNQQPNMAAGQHSAPFSRLGFFFRLVESVFPQNIIVARFVPIIGTFRIYILHIWTDLLFFVTFFNF